MLNTLGASALSAPSSSPTGPTGTAPSGMLQPGLNQAVGTASAQAPGETSAPDLFARAPGLLTLRPTDLSTVVGQEFRVDVATPKFDAFTESLVTVSYDPKVAEFRRVGPGSAAISVRATEGQVTLTMRRQGTAGTGESILAMLFFQAKTKGELTLTMEATTEPSGAPGVVTKEQALIHVQ